MTPQPPQPFWDIGAFPSIFWILSSKKEGLTTWNVIGIKKILPASPVLRIYID